MILKKNKKGTEKSKEIEYNKKNMELEQIN